MKRRAEYDQINQAAARVIVADIARYGGETALLVKWAQAVLARAEAEANTAAEAFELVGEEGR